MISLVQMRCFPPHDKKKHSDFSWLISAVVNVALSVALISGNSFFHNDYNYLEKGIGFIVFLVPSKLGYDLYYYEHI